MAVLMQGVGLINFEVYLDGKSRMLGISNVELSNIEYETVEMKGAGLMGTIAMPVRGNMSDLEMKLTWRTMTSEVAELSKHKSVKLSLYSGQESYDAGSGELKVPKHQIEVSCVPKGLNLGKWEPSSTVDDENTFTVITLNYKIDDKEVLAFDKANYVLRVNGADQTEAFRRAVGLI